jgi:ABC-type Fe3+ transport system substrate-binding protein
MIFELATNDSDDAKIAIEAAKQMAERFKEPVAILFDYSTVLLRRNNMPAIEIVYPEFWAGDRYG